MSDPISKPAFGDSILADKAIKAYAEGLGVLSKEECDELGLDSKKCGMLTGVMAWDEEGIVTERERQKLSFSGFSKEFIDTFAGIDGHRPINENIKWLAGHSASKWYLDDFYACWQSMERLGKFGPAAATATDALVDILNDPFEYSFIKDTAIEALGKIRSSPETAVPALLKFVNAKDWSTRTVAIAALGAFGEAAAIAVPELRKRLFDEKASVQQWAAEALGDIGPAAAPAIPDLMAKALNTSLARSCIEALGKIGRGTGTTIPFLLGIMAENMGTYCDAEKAIGRMGMAAVPDIVRIILGPDKKLAYAAEKTLPEFALARFDKPPQEVVNIIPALAKLANDKYDFHTRSAAIEILIKLGPAAKAAVPALIEALNDPKGDTTLYIVMALGAIGPDARDAVRPIIDIANGVATYHGNDDTGLIFPNALANIGEEAIPDLISAFNHKSLFVQQIAIKAIGIIGPRASGAVDDLIKKLLRTSTPDPNYDVRDIVIEALGRIGPEAGRAVPTLIKFISGDNAFTNILIFDALMNIGPAAAEAIPAFVDFINNKDVNIWQKGKAAIALAGIGIHGILALMNMLKDIRPQTRINGANALNSIGYSKTSREIRFAIPDLQRMLDYDPDPDCRNAATEALKSIQKNIL